MSDYATVMETRDDKDALDELVHSVSAGLFLVVYFFAWDCGN